VGLLCFREGSIARNSNARTVTSEKEIARELFITLSVKYSDKWDEEETQLEMLKPSAGTVALQGQHIGGIDPARILGLGVAQVEPGNFRVV
jgi:hypothetical protein